MLGIQPKDLLVLGNSVSVDRVWTQERLSPWIEASGGKHERDFYTRLALHWFMEQKVRTDVRLPMDMLLYNQY